jgi:hypothetical protein
MYFLHPLTRETMLWSMYAYLDADVLMMKYFHSLNNTPMVTQRKNHRFNLFLPKQNKPSQH